MVPSTLVALDQTSPDEYRLYRVGALELNATRRIWINAYPNAAVKHLMIDRLIFIRGDVK